MRNYALLITLWMGLAVCVQAFDLVGPAGQPAAVYCAADASEADRNAATQLIEYVKAATGVTLPLTDKWPVPVPRVVVGNCAASRELLSAVNPETLRADETVIATPAPGTLVLTGAAPRGSLYAVYSLLEEFGVRFWSPDHEFVPKLTALTVPDGLLRRYAPPFSFRQAASESTQHHREWSAKLKLNGSLWQPPIPAAFGGDRVMDMRHSLVRDYVKADAFFATHPEWYAWRADEKKRMPTQLCTSNEEALQELVREVREDLRQHPEWDFVSISFDDNDKFCQCDACAALMAKEGSPAALSATAANYVARAIKEEFPHVTVSLMAYWKVERPPASLKLEPNVAVVFALLDRNHGLPPAATARHNEYLGGWSRLANGNVYIWDYYATFGNFLLPMPNLYIMQDAFRTYADFGVKGIFAQLPYGTLAEFLDLRTWLFAQLAWNPYLDAHRLVAEFLAGHYGAAAPYLQRYIDLLETARDRRRGTWIGVYSEETSHWLTADDVLDGMALFDQALAATAADPAAYRRVDGLRASILMTAILRYNEVAEAAKKRGVTLPERSAMIDDLDALGREFQCTTYKEWDDFSNLIKRLRETPAPPVPAHTAQVPVTIGADQLTGNGVTVVEREHDGKAARLAVDAAALGYPFMQPALGEIAYELPPGLAGEWEVAVTLRAAATVDRQPDAAYLGIYAPHEISRMPFSVSRGERGWQTVSLGKCRLPAKSRIWVMPGVVAPVDFIEVKSVALTPAGH